MLNAFRRSLHLLWDRGSVQKSKKICMELVLSYGLFFAGGFKNTPVNTDGPLMC